MLRHIFSLFETQCESIRFLFLFCEYIQYCVLKVLYMLKLYSYKRIMYTMIRLSVKLQKHKTMKDIIICSKDVKLQYYENSQEK